MELIHTCYRVTDPDRRSRSTRRSVSRSGGELPIREEAVNIFLGLPA